MDIITLPITYDKKKIDSKYRLAVIVSQRAKELLFGSQPKVEKTAAKTITTAILEIMEGNIDFISGNEASIALAKLNKINFKKIIDEKRKKFPSDITELEKDLKSYLYEKDRDLTEKALEDLFNGAK